MDENAGPNQKAPQTGEGGLWILVLTLLGRRWVIVGKAVNIWMAHFSYVRHEVIELGF